MRIPNPLLATAVARPDHVVLRCEGRALAARELANRVARRAAGLRALGVGPGDRVALRGEADEELVIALHAVGWLGAAALPVGSRLTDQEVQPLLEGCRARLGDLPEAAPLTVEGPPCPAADWSLDDVRLLVATSGTTGAPRLIPLTVGQLLFSAFGSAIRLGHLPSDRWIACLPLNHVGGLSILFRCAWYGTTVELHPTFAPEAVNQAIDAGASLLSVVPVMLERLLDARGDRPFPSTLRAILLGGARAPEPLLARCRAVGAPVALTWGMTEAASQVATRFPGDLEGSGAPPLPFATVEDARGLLRIRGPLVNGEHLTADRGHIDARGWVHVQGRADDVIISGGENIDPREIEDVLLAHPGVTEVAVAAVSDPVWSERPVAWYVGEPLPVEVLTAWCADRLARFKVPDRFHRVPALPRNALGKLVRRDLREPEPPPSE